MRGPNLNFIYNDGEIFALNKPAQIHSVSNPNSDDLSIAKLLLEQHPHLSAASEKPGDAGLANRLDFETSGVLFGAWKRDTWLNLRKTERAGRIQKRYLAIVEGKAPKKRAVHTLIGSPYRRGTKVRIQETGSKPIARFKPAETRIELIDYDSGHNLSIVQAELKRGQRHQVRAHAAWTGHPLVGDTLYGSTTKLNHLRYGSLKFALHALSLNIQSTTGPSISIKAECNWFS